MRGKVGRWLLHAEFGLNDHRKDTPLLISNKPLKIYPRPKLETWLKNIEADLDSLEAIHQIKNTATYTGSYNFIYVVYTIVYRQGFHNYACHTPPKHSFQYSITSQQTVYRHLGLFRSLLTMSSNQNQNTHLRFPPILWICWIWK